MWQPCELLYTCYLLTYLLVPTPVTLKNAQEGLLELMVGEGVAEGIERTVEIAQPVRYVVQKVRQKRRRCSAGPSDGLDESQVTELRVVHGSILCGPIQPNPSADRPNPTQSTTSGKIWTQSNTTNKNKTYILVATVSGTCQIGRKNKFNCLVQPNLI